MGSPVSCGGELEQLVDQGEELLGLLGRDAGFALGLEWMRRAWS
jgi:hypothetical protein